ncbi:MAG: hypothetical protein GXP55_07125 [Deltaproteobacteria bacterium]|nr:hypothetical protein [Deltaproteobacteria bacterium]
MRRGNAHLLCAGLLALMVATSSRSSAQDAPEPALREIVATARTDEARPPTNAIRDLLTSRAARSFRPEVRGTLACVEALLRDAELQRGAQRTRGSRTTVARYLTVRLTEMMQALDELSPAYTRCLDHIEATAANVRVHATTYANRRRALGPWRVEAGSLREEVREQWHRSPTDEEAWTRLLKRYRRLAREIPSVDVDARKQTTRGYLASLHFPRTRRHWGARSTLPAQLVGMTAGLAFMGGAIWSLPSAGPEGRPVPHIVIGGFGFMLSAAAAIPAALSWAKPSLALVLTGSALTLATGTLGAFALARGQHRRRYFGAGLLLGSALDLALVIGGIAHLVSDKRTNGIWSRYLRASVRVTPWASPDGAGAMLAGRF